MPNNKSYSEKLRSPKWQKRRLEILERDGWACQNCGDTEATLNVHHCYYDRDKEPWDYPGKSLITLCENCHMLERGAIRMTYDRMEMGFNQSGFISKDFLLLIEDIDRWNIVEDKNFLMYAFSEILKNRDLQKKIIKMTYGDVKICQKD
jgi:hypothetical protein